MRYLCIVNPEAGKGFTAKIWPAIKNNMEKLRADLLIEFTQHPGHAVEIAREAKNLDINGIIIVGGDGTLHEVINGLAGLSIPLGLIPTGSGNDLSRTLNIPQDPLEAIIVIAQGKTIQINIGEVNDGYFLNLASIGFDAAVANWVNKNKVFKGKYAYWAAIFYHILRNKHYKLTINMDGNLLEKECTLVAVANGKYYGAGQKIAPQAALGDGLFDVVIVSAVTRMEIIKTLPGIRAGKHVENPHVTIYKAKNVIIDSEKKKNIPVQADGEKLGELPQAFQISKKELKLFIP
ncbi:MAG: diacylglycerol/lipid kinase family protein [Peptococcaceae bacterium]